MHDMSERKRACLRVPLLSCMIPRVVIGSTYSAGSHGLYQRSSCLLCASGFGRVLVKSNQTSITFTHKYKNRSHVQRREPPRRRERPVRLCVDSFLPCLWRPHGRWKPRTCKRARIAVCRGVRILVLLCNRVGRFQRYRRSFEPTMSSTGSPASRAFCPFF